MTRKKKEKIMPWPYTKLKTEPKFEIYNSKDGKFRFRLRAPNGEIIAVSEAYESKSSCENGIKSVKTNAVKGKIVDLTE